MPPAVRLHTLTLALLAWPLAAGAQARPPVPATWTNSIGMPFVRIPAGSFRMGSDESPERLARDFPGMEPARLASLADEAPVHTVRITRPFYLGQTEVTVGQFRRFIQASGYRAESEADGTGGYGYNPAYDPAKSARGDAFEGRDPRYSWRNPGFAQGDDHPVVNVTWHDAHALAAWLSATEGHRYRLPTEAEWEYACRAGQPTRYGHGDDPAALPRHANTFDRDAAPHWPRWQAQAVPGHDGHAFTAPVASYPPNAFGLHDMSGNAWEWVSDWHDDDAYAHAPRDDPQGPATGTVRVRRGGSWHTWPLYARCTYRNWNSPETRYTLVGMRLVREVNAAPSTTPRHRAR
ncbi:formylglycine-generating enzyme family protein [Acidovorax sp. NCPPB 4044]|uniref:formylglycine-generating enzyme family protein n=1 Tax=Acidovorax sp. NCPPB 4044 TaxID=2940490 RepID=UPI0023042705|nr:formylglycine-generating enzyme family protein [Acidovorax sp. NCPPB 4044]MDA8523710.1 formylglycine-generating enzyme family protein [Acidovorax sp. NCPPB 4044]